MFINIFPKTLLGMAKQTFPRHRLQSVMLPLISPQEYLRQATFTSADRQMLSDNELAEAQSFALEKRQNEWLTARLAAKSAMLQYHATSPSNPPAISPKEITITNDQTGRPQFSQKFIPQLRNTDLSMSHGAGFGLALVADTRCGIDIQEPRESITKVRDKFCTPEEEELLRQPFHEIPERQYLTLLWTAKEAAKKALSHTRMPGFMELILTELEPHAAGWTIHFLISSRQFEGYPATIRVVAELYEPYSLALCLSGEVINA